MNTPDSKDFSKQGKFMDILITPHQRSKPIIGDNIVLIWIKIQNA